MKWFLIIFSLYVVILSGIPCDCQEDDYACNTTEPADHRKPDCPCSPFFACSTCHGVVLPDAGVKLTRPVYTPNQQVFHPYQENAVSQYPLPVFQPPRLA
ncbi:hypothetical protein SAMN04488122_3408 [Chitinophaga arvensicola]|uniref:Uncharacterized protein n=1 Tax=Chitinophaga arvensicola TaxID=29529 RepID=A0A1I0RUC4_9BACT|nr:hypothetical protein SAMN04488122_3408 [Chitinophaga arvensicola]